VAGDFAATLVSLSIAFTAMALAAWAGGRQLAIPLRGRWVAWGFIGLWCVGATCAYASTWGQFVTLRAQDAVVELRYAGGWQLPVRLQADEIQTVLVGWGKPGRPCYLRVVLEDGSSHRSSELPAPVAQCRTLQAQLLAWKQSRAPVAPQSAR
jgi:hypothetical protein